MGTSKTTKILTLVSTLMLATIGVVSTSNAMPVDPKLGHLEAAAPCIRCQLEQGNAGLETTRKNLLHMVSIISPDGKDPRVVQDRSGKGNQFAPIGLIRFPREIMVNGEKVLNPKRNLTGTAFLVSPCLILTEAHVVYGTDTSVKREGDAEMVFEAGERGTPNHEVAVAKSLISGGNSDVGSDFALMKLEPGPDGKCMGERLGWLSTKLVNTGEIPRFTSAGFPVDRSEAKLIVQKNCKLIQGDGQAITECASVPGNSGSPVMVVPKVGVPTVVAILSATLDVSSKVQKTMDKHNENYATQMGDIIDSIDMAIFRDSKDKVNVLDGQQNPSVRLSSAK